MNNNKYILGIDTSNYKTSVAVTGFPRNVICDFRRLLTVKQGEKGLRQSDALFQHVKNIPLLMEEIRSSFDGTFSAIAYSSRPRPLKCSYMPVFLAGEGFASSLASAMQIPAVGLSHQEGHIEAVRAFSSLKDKPRFLACHFSGGTCELLKVSVVCPGEGHAKSTAYDAAEKVFFDIEIVGGSRDISFGQVIDRAGVAMGIEFPAGEEMDKYALSSERSTELLTDIKVHDAWLNLSGIDTQVKNILLQDKISESEGQACLARELFDKTADAMLKMISQGCEITGINDVLMAGGVSSSMFIKDILSEGLNNRGINAEFDLKGLSQDNAVGTALLGGKFLWD